MYLYIITKPKFTVFWSNDVVFTPHFNCCLFNSIQCQMMNGWWFEGSILSLHLFVFLNIIQTFFLNFNYIFHPSVYLKGIKILKRKWRKVISIRLYFKVMFRNSHFFFSYFSSEVFHNFITATVQSDEKRGKVWWWG